MSSFIDLALRQRVLVIALALILAAGGLYAFRTIAIDAFPDVTTVLVQVVTEAQGLSPAEIERFVTFPLELQLTGAPGLTDIRSLSKVGLSMITLVFRDDIDIYLARQVVLERILEVQDNLPPGAVSQLVPNSTALGEVYQFYLEGPHDEDPDFVMTDAELMERRTFEDWVVRPLLKGLPDVVDVNSIGGFVKQYQVMVEPGLLRKYDLALHDVFEAVAKTTPTPAATFWKRARRSTSSAASASSRHCTTSRTSLSRKPTARRSTCATWPKCRSATPCGTAPPCSTASAKSWPASS